MVASSDRMIPNDCLIYSQAFGICKDEYWIGRKALGMWITLLMSILRVYLAH